MANNSVTALNTAVGNGAADNVTANASAANAVANAGGGTGRGTAATAADPTWVADFCNSYGDVLVWSGLAFLGLALLLGLASALIALLAAWKARKPVLEEGLREAVPDPAKFVEALKGLVEALAKAPAWFALFLGGALLLWMAGSLAEDVCTPNRADQNVNAQSPNQQSRTSGTRDGNSQAAAGNMQGTGTGPGTKSGR